MPRKRMDGIRIHLMLTKPQHRAISALREKTGLPFSEIMRRAVDRYLRETLSSHSSDSDVR